MQPTSDVEMNIDGLAKLYGEVVNDGVGLDRFGPSTRLRMSSVHKGLRDNDDSVLAGVPNRARSPSAP